LTRKRIKKVEPKQKVSDCEEKKLYHVGKEELGEEICAARWVRRNHVRACERNETGWGEYKWSALENGCYKHPPIRGKEKVP